MNPVPDLKGPGRRRIGTGQRAAVIYRAPLRSGVIESAPVLGSYRSPGRGARLGRDGSMDSVASPSSGAGNPGAGCRGGFWVGFLPVSGRPKTTASLWRGAPMYQRRSK